VKSNGVGVALGVVALLALAIPHGSAAAEPARASAQVTSAGAAAEAPERVENLRLQRITSGPMRGRLVVAGSLDHLPDEGVARDVLVRMSMTVPRGDGRSRTVGRKLLDYRLPAGVSPQNLTLRWLLSERESRLVDRAGDAARVSVVVRETLAAGPISTHLKVAERLRVEPLFVPPSLGPTPKATTIFIPGGFYMNGTTYLWTAEDPKGAPYVGGAGDGGPSAYKDGFILKPLWIQRGATSGSPGPGGGYVYMNGSVPSWSISTLWSPNCTRTATISGTFSGAYGGYMSWDTFYCGPANVPFVWGGQIWFGDNAS
jgi:hypothetical protein